MESKKFYVIQCTKTLNEGHTKVQIIYKLMKIYWSQCKINHGVM